MKLLDTDTCVGVLRGNRRVLDHRAAAAREEVATTWVTAAELYFGAARSDAPDRGRGAVTAFLATLRIFEPDLASARLFGDAKAALRQAGAVVEDADLWIASIALARGAVVVTGNRRHFDRIPGVRLEDWLP